MKDKILNKILNFLIIFLLIYLTFSLIQSKEKENRLSNSIVLKNSKTYTIPAGVKIEIKNETLTGFTFNTCRDFLIKKDGNVIKLEDCKDISISPGGSYTLDLSKDYLLFKEVGKYYVNLKKEKLDIISQFEIENKGFFGKFFTFFFYAPIYNLMVFLLKITGYSLGWAIVIMTIIIRLILLVPQHKIMVNQIKMQKIQPKIREIQEKYKKDYQTLGMELMKLYKEEKVNPMGSCGLLIIQMPILIVIYQVIISIQSKLNTYYLYDFLNDYNASNINPIFFGLDLFGVGGTNGVILAIVIGFLQYLQIKLSLVNNAHEKTQVIANKDKKVDSYQEFMPNPELLNKFMLYGMPLIVAIVTYALPAGLGLYWGVGTLFTIIQQLFVNKVSKN